MYLFTSNEARFNIASYARKKIIFSKKFYNLNNKPTEISSSLPGTQC